MRAQELIPELPEIEGLHSRIDRWRQSQPKSRAMPEELWREAIAAARKLGAGRVARALGLNYETLKQRVLPNASAQPGDGRRPKARAEVTEFIELSGFAARDQPQAGAPEELVIEMVAADGARLTIRARTMHENVAALINAFRGRS